MAGMWNAGKQIARLSSTFSKSLSLNTPLLCKTLCPLPFSAAEVTTCSPLSLRTFMPVVISTRQTSFFNKLPAEDLWKGVISVSNAGKKRGRGKGAGRKSAKDLNRGQYIGVGKANMVWPGLNSPVIQNREVVQQRKLPEDPERQAKLLKMRDDMGAFRVLGISPLKRGWSGIKLPGRSIGAPDPIGEDNFEGFDTTVLEFKTVCNMKGNLGRTRRISAFVVTGNGNGLAGFAIGKAQLGSTALRKAKNRASQKLIHVERYNDHTVLHDFFCQFGKTRIFVQKRPEGYGLVCHRVIREICKSVGIKDIYAKVEGSTKNVQHVAKAFMMGLLQQKSFNKIAEDTKLHVVELRRECDDFPRIVASPSEVKSSKAINDMDINLHLNDGKVAAKKKKHPLFYQVLPSWQNHIAKTERFRNHKQVRINLLAEYGEERSFLAEKYPECRRVSYIKTKEED